MGKLKRIVFTEEKIRKLEANPNVGSATLSWTEKIRACRINLSC